MKIYKEKVVITKVETECLCNSCGETIQKEIEKPGLSRKWACEIVIDWHNRGSFPGSSSGIHKLDVCLECYENKFSPLLKKLPTNSETYYEDSRTIEIEPTQSN